MIVSDRVYGKIEIKNKLILDLLRSSPVIRLKKIKQAGPTALLIPSRVMTRFEHSVGVWYILKKFGASLEEQVAGLLHDTPHTAFSHVADALFPNKNHTFHEQFEEEIIKSSDIPEILKKHNMNLGKILNKGNFHLLEAELPDLSADRIDYFLRDTRIDPIFPDSIVTLFLKDMSVRNSKFYFKTPATALLYANLFMEAGKFLWLDAASHGSHELLAQTLRRALETEIMTMHDLFKDDDEVLKLLQKSKDKVIQKHLAELTPKKKFDYAIKSEARFWGPNKPRLVDPFVDYNGKLVRISEIYTELKKIFADFKATYSFVGVK